MLEAFAAQLAAQRRTTDQLEEIRRWFETGAATAANDIVHAAHAHRQFHLAIQRRRQQLPRARRRAAAGADRAGVLVLVDRRGLIGWQEHVDILAAIEAGDADAAQQAARRHMSSVLNDLRRSAGAAGNVPAAAAGRWSGRRGRPPPGCRRRWRDRRAFGGVGAGRRTRRHRVRVEASRHAHHRPVGGDAVGDLRPAPGVRPCCASRAFLEHPPAGFAEHPLTARSGCCGSARRRPPLDEIAGVAASGVAPTACRIDEGEVAARWCRCSGRRRQRRRRVGARCPQARRRRDGVRLCRRGEGAGRRSVGVAPRRVAHPYGDGGPWGATRVTMASRRSPSMSWSTPPEHGATSSPRSPGSPARPAPAAPDGVHRPGPDGVVVAARDGRRRTLLLRARVGRAAAVSGRRVRATRDAVAEMEDVAWALEMLNQATTLDARHVRSSWAGLRTFTADRVPAVGWEPDVPGFLWLVGQGGGDQDRAGDGGCRGRDHRRQDLAGRPRRPGGRAGGAVAGAVQMSPPTTSTVAATVDRPSTAARVHPRSR